MRMKERKTEKERGISQNGDKICGADGGSGGGVGGCGGCGWIEGLVVKGVGTFALTAGDQQRPTERRKGASDLGENSTHKPFHTR